MADTWRIDPSGVRQSTQLTSSGTGFINVWTVPYTITSGPARGISGTVQIPEDLYSAVEVAKAVQSAVDAHTDVASL
jgi:hypothetical protein